MPNMENNKKIKCALISNNPNDDIFFNRRLCTYDHESKKRGQKNHVDNDDDMFSKLMSRSSSC